ncbi:Espin [Geodia barretti]|uniref:Espin n=1 Tax=Geodia barretti TaxID=519541 RepID=A0AA35R496_GEOBA|nr:Espin [Geodia barretti]
MSSTEDKLYSRLNTRGRKSFRPTERAQLAEKFPEFATVGLPAHKAALDGNVEALREIYAAFTEDGVPSRDVNGATPLHLAVRGNRMEAVKWLLRFTDLSPTISAKHGESPCHVAAALGNTECLKAMLATDAKEDICVASDNSGM